MRTKSIIAIVLSVSLLCFVSLVLTPWPKSDAAESVGKSPFDLEALSAAPNVYPAEDADLQAEGVQALFYEGAPYQGKPTRVFAYVGYPDGVAGAAGGGGKKAPAMVLIHGGGGTAFDRWVKVWTARGYAAIAMDVCGCVPVGTYGNWKRHEHGGPPGWDASFQQLDSPVSDQWTYHAVSAAILGHSLLRADERVDAERIGVTGISWGGYLTSIVAGVDSRFKFAAPVYGCGFLGENSAWLPAFEKLGAERAGLWLSQWDPSVYLSQAAMPMLWVNGTNDFAYPMDSWQKSYRLPKNEKTLALRIRMPHGHGPAGENPEEIHIAANHYLRGEAPLARFLKSEVKGDSARVEFESDAPIVKAELCFTRDRGKWQDRNWEAAPARVELALGKPNEGSASATIPDGAAVYYINLFDDRDCVVSSEHLER